MRRYLAVLIVGGLPAWPAAGETPARPDPHSFSRPDQVAVTHLSLELEVSFEARRLSGVATLTLDNRSGASELVLDTRQLDVQEVHLADGTPTEFELGDEQEFLGRPLSIRISPDTRQVRVRYATRPDAPALQWLTPEQTAGRRHPFLFTQSQAALARSWVPIQDGPGVRFTYDAVVRVPEPLRPMMSADNPTAAEADGSWRFSMTNPIPAYLLALAVGEVEFRALDERIGVWAEPSVIEKAAWEFADTPRYMEAAERLYGPYRWGRYDLLVLPPSFPYGGMENPCLTFVTPTLLAGDRSQAGVVAHELAHSWSGNLVTNATWNDFWLNEGFTTYIEHRLMEAVHGRDHSEMLAALTRQSLDRELELFRDEPDRTRLKTDLRGDPDDSFTSIPYDKGYFFLRLLEETFGRAAFDAFLRRYFDANAFGSVDTAAFVSQLNAELLDAAPQQATSIGVAEWIYEPALPSNCPRVRSSRFEDVDVQVAAFAKGAGAQDLETAGWTTHEWLRFLAGLPADVSLERMAELDAAFGFTHSGNTEILAEWFLRVIERGYGPGWDALERFLTAYGRRKYLRPLYRKLAETDAGLARGRAIFEKVRSTYHPLAQQDVTEILKLD